MNTNRYNNQYILKCSSCERNFLDENIKEVSCRNCKGHKWWNELSLKEKMNGKIVREWVMWMNKGY